MAVSVDELLQRNPARLWRARGSGAGGAAPSGLPTGHAALDACLPGGGWPRQGLVEILSDQRGIGELQLLMPALARLRGCIAWVSPPCVPYAPALAEWGVDVGRVLVVHGAGATEWAMSVALRSEACSAVLGWAACRDRQSLRRLQLAAEQSRCLAVLFRGLAAGREPSPAVLRIALEGTSDGLEARVLKSRGGREARVQLGWISAAATVAH